MLIATGWPQCWAPQIQQLLRAGQAGTSYMADGGMHTLANDTILQNALKFAIKLSYIDILATNSWCRALYKYSSTLIQLGRLIPRLPSHHINVFQVQRLSCPSLNTLKLLFTRYHLSWLLWPETLSDNKYFLGSGFSLTSI